MRSSAALAIPAESGEARVGASMGGLMKGMAGRFYPKSSVSSNSRCLARAAGVLCVRPSVAGPTQMTQFNENDLTAEVVKSFDNTPDPRAKFLLQELVKSLHDYVRKTDLTFAEWEYAIDFLPRPGHKCPDIRQEFILLSDVMG